MGYDKRGLLDIAILTKEIMGGMTYREIGLKWGIRGESVGRLAKKWGLGILREKYLEGQREIIDGN